MNSAHPLSRLAIAAGIGLLALPCFAQTTPGDGPYKIVKMAQTNGTGGIDYVYADNDNRRLYVPRGGQVLVFDLDTLKTVGAIPNTKGVHGVAVDPKSKRGFASSNPITMWDTDTLETIKTIDVQGRPDGILFEPLTGRIYVLSHSEPNVTVLDGRDGSIVGTIDLGGAPEQAASDGAGHVYVDLEDKDKIAVMDANTLKVTGNFDLQGKGGGPGGLGLDAKNHVLFAFCHEPATAVILSSNDGRILDTLPIGNGTDGGGFNPATMEAFSSQGRDGTLTIIKEVSATNFVVEQNLKTKPGAKTCTLDTKNNQIVLITVERPPTPPGTVETNAPPAAGGPPGGGRRGGRGGPGILDILVVGQ